MTSPRTVQDAITLAESHWSGRPGARVMGVTTRRAGKLVGLAKPLSGLPQAAQGVALLRALREDGLSPKAVQDYYLAFRRALKLAGVDTVQWPKAPTPPRKSRDKLEGDDVARLIGWLDTQGYGDTADWAAILRATGIRGGVEGLAGVALRVGEIGKEFDTLHVTGKGGHERVIPVTDGRAREVLSDRQRLESLRAVSYSTHLRRFNKAVAALGIKSRLATPHAVRHTYGSEVLRLSGGNLIMVQELLGHASPATTARYLDVGMEAKADVLRKASDHHMENSST